MWLGWTKLKISGILATAITVCLAIIRLQINGQASEGVTTLFWLVTPVNAFLFY